MSDKNKMEIDEEIQNGKVEEEKPRAMSIDDNDNDMELKERLLEEIRVNSLNDDRYAGLSNQGNTCYLNSLLQSLFMTPELRSNILKWKYNEELHGSKKDSIPYNLKKLFTRLQLRIKSAEETRDLTKSFQWEGGEVFQQHDIQELCRVLFDAIEQSLGPNTENFINSLYSGTQSSVVECLQCHQKSINESKYLDFNLPIRNDFERIYNKNLEEAFLNYIRPEKLEKDNQYACDNCKSKVDALKYVKINTLPKILTVQFNRFEYDWQSDQRKKIHDYVTFPQVLNLNPVIFKDYDFIANNLFTPDAIAFLEKRQPIDEKECQELINEYIKEGEFVYELFSIVIHSGNALGGHYFAYIKSFEDDKWYSFNDSTVRQINKDDIKSVYGRTQNEVSNGTAYVLMYRQYTKDKINSVPNELIDNELLKNVIHENALILEEERKRKEKLNALTLKVYLNGIMKEINVKKTDKVALFKQKIIDEFELKDVVFDDCHIRAYSSNNNRPQEYYDNEDITLDAANVFPYRNYTLGFRQDGVFESFDPDMITILICKWKPEFINYQERDLPFHSIRLNRNKESSILLSQIYKDFELKDTTPIHILRKLDYTQNSSNLQAILNNDTDLSKPLFLCAIYDMTKIFIEEIDEENKETPYFMKLFNDKLSVITVRFNTPVNKLIPLNEITVRSYKFSHEFQCTKSTTLEEIKERIANELKLDQNEFIIRKYSHNGLEIRDLKVRVDTLTIASVNIYVEYGKPLAEGEVKVNIVHCVQEFTRFALFPFKFIDYGHMIINEKKTIGEIKEDILKFLKETHNLELRSDNTVLRETLTERPSKIFNDECLASIYKFNDNKKILVEENTLIEKNFNPDHLQVFVRWWKPGQWTMSDPIDIHIPKKSKLSELSKIIEKKFPDINIEKVQVYKVINGYNIFMDDLERYTFTSLNENPNYNIENFPFFINNDGSLLILKEEDEITRLPTEDERAFYCRPQLNYQVTALVPVMPTTDDKKNTGNKISSIISELDSKNIGFTTRTRIKEKPLVIRVKKNEDNENKSTTTANKEGVITIDLTNDSPVNNPKDITDNNQSDTQMKLNEEANENSSKKVKDNKITIDDYEVDAEFYNDEDNISPLI